MATITTMNNAELLNKVKKIKALEELIKEAKVEMEALKDEVKETMGDAEEVVVGHYIVRHKVVVTNKFDSNLFKSMMPEVYKAYTKQGVERRFKIS